MRFHAEKYKIIEHHNRPPNFLQVTDQIGTVLLSTVSMDTLQRNYNFFNTESSTVSYRPILNEVHFSKTNAKENKAEWPQVT